MYLLQFIGFTVIWVLYLRCPQHAAKHFAKAAARSLPFPPLNISSSYFCRARSRISRHRLARRRGFLANLATAFAVGLSQWNPFVRARPRVLIRVDNRCLWCWLSCLTIVKVSWPWLSWATQEKFKPTGCAVPTNAKVNKYHCGVIASPRFLQWLTCQDIQAGDKIRNLINNSHAWQIYLGSNKTKLNKGLLLIFIQFFAWLCYAMPRLQSSSRCLTVAGPFRCSCQFDQNRTFSHLWKSKKKKNTPDHLWVEFSSTPLYQCAQQNVNSLANRKFSDSLSTCSTGKDEMWSAHLQLVHWTFWRTVSYLGKDLRK